jgi:hypothetical protein
VIRALFALSQNREVSSLVASTDMPGPIRSIVENFLNNPEHAAERRSRIIADTVSIAHYVQAYNSVLLIPPSLPMALARHQPLSVTDSAVGLFSRLILTDLGTHLPDFLPIEFVLQLCNSVKWRPAGAKLRSADLLCLLSN